MNQKIVKQESSSAVMRDFHCVPRALFILAFLMPLLPIHSQYLKRSVQSTPVVKTEISTSSASYKPLFGAGDKDHAMVKGISRYGLLTIDSGGVSRSVVYPAEEIILFVLEGTGDLKCGKDRVPVSRNDFMYVPAGMKISFSNPRERPLSVFVMGFKIQPDNKVRPSGKFMIANTDQVKFQEVGNHGPTALFQLLMGTTESKRDRLASACQMTSLFIMDFAPGGTNIPHRHAKEEEIYYILRGKGDIVAGETTEKKEQRHPSVAGDVYFFSPKTLIGFYSGNEPGEEHPRILAVRFTYPAQTGE